MSERMDLAGLTARLRAWPAGERAIVALAGAPASGKSTAAARLAEALNADVPGRAAVLGMDGYHYDDAVLEARGRRAMKGAPDTFDVAGLGHMLFRLRARDAAEVAVPVFDRALEVARAGAGIISHAAEVILVEGNYLLLADPPWSGLHRYYDLTVRLEVPEAELRARLTARWQHYRLDEAQIRFKLDEVDLPNGRAVLAGSVAPDVLLIP